MVVTLPYFINYVYLIDICPAGAFQGHLNKTTELNLKRLRIPTGRRQTTWLYASAAEELN